MAATHISFDDQSSHGRQLRRCLSLIDEGFRNTEDLLATLGTMIDGDGTDAAHFAIMKTKCGFPDTATAKIAWEALLGVKAIADLEVSQGVNVRTALKGAFRRFG